MRLGTWGANLNTKDLERYIDACLDLGLNDFDHADIYGDYTEEAHFGEVVKRRPDLKSKIQITTKCGIQLITPNRAHHQLKSYNSTPAHILQSVENSLQALGVDHLDVLLLHRPDFLMHPQAIAEAFEQLKTAGKVRAFGVSNFTKSQFEMLHQLTPLITNQIEVSLTHRNAFFDGTLDQCLSLGITPTAWSPLGGGAIFTDTDNPRIAAIQKVGHQLAETHNVSLDQILLAWVLKHPSGIIPVVGSTKIERVAAAKAATQIQLSHEQWYALWEAATGAEVP